MSDAEFFAIMMEAGVPPPSLSTNAISSPASTDLAISTSVNEEEFHNSSNEDLVSDFDNADSDGDLSATYLEASPIAAERPGSPRKGADAEDKHPSDSIVPTATASLTSSGSSSPPISPTDYSCSPSFSSIMKSFSSFSTPPQRMMSGSDADVKSPEHVEVPLRKSPSLQKNYEETKQKSPTAFESILDTKPSLGKPLSATKTFLVLLSDPNNRSCADCRTPLVDSSSIYASYYNPQMASFASRHKTFAPDGKVPSKTPSMHNPSEGEEKVDPASFSSERAGGHGVFLCKACSAAHRALGPSVTHVKAINDSTWTSMELHIMKQSGGNLRSRVVYERYMPQHWISHIPSGSSTLHEREVFARAKYEMLAFLFPSGPLASPLWHPFGASGVLLDSTGQVDLTSVTAAEKKGSDLLPSRLIDYFCVVGPNGKIETRTPIPSEAENRKMSSSQRPEDLTLGIEVVDCFPKQDAHADMDFPRHLPRFVFPDGCIPMTEHRTPTFFTFVLTLENGTRLYGAALNLYNDAVETERLGHMAKESGFEDLPAWMTNGSFDSSKALKTLGRRSEIVFLPKCLVVLSHYCFFDVMRSFLLQLYRISLVQAPLPIERYIANFVCEVPLPPQGKIEVNFALTDELQVSIVRPAANRLPLVGFSYHPLFASLSVGNILVVLGCLLKETRVAICSQHYALLGPVCEALTSLLFPFVWQGMYIPIMPYSMLDVLDAPVPFLVGLHSRYLKDVQAPARPIGVVFVDLDYDIVHLGFEDEDLGSGSLYGRCTPALPDKDAAKLRSKLEEFGGIAYIPSEQGVVGRITYGDGQNMTNKEREAYAVMSRVHVPMASKSERSNLMEMSDKAFPDNEILKPIHGFATEEGTLTEKEIVKSDGWKMKGLKAKKGSSGSLSSQNKEASPRENPLNMNELAGFSTSEIRNATLRFFASIFKNYEKFLVKGGGEPFQREAFLDDLKLKGNSREFVSQVTSSQMFERFVEERITSPDQPEMRLFDETIVAKNNRSKKTVGKKKETPFLSDQSGNITDTFAPPPPSNWGLPDDGRSYHYGMFPKLDPKAFGKIRYPKQWSAKQKQRGASSAALREQNKIMSNHLAQPVSVTPTKPVGSKDPQQKNPIMNVEWAIHALSYNDSVGDFQSGATRDVALPSDTISSAMKEVLSARRKQSILLKLIIRAQACCRMYIIRTRYLRLCVEFKKRYDKALLTEENVTQLVTFILSIVRIQRMFRAFKKRLEERQKIHATRLQGWLRGEIARRYFQRLKMAALMAQAFARGRKVRFAFKLVKDLVAKVQAQVRGYLTRKQVAIFREDRVMRYRLQIFELWKHARTPLTYRSNFWMLINGKGFLHLSLTENELKRLWELLGIVFLSNSDTNQGELDRSASGMFIPGTSTSVHERYLQVKSMMKGSDNKEPLDIFPAEMAALRSQTQLSMAKERLELERGQIYEKLSSIKDKGKLTSVYDSLGFSSGERKKKNRFANFIWTSLADADKSAAVMHDLFPELIESTNIGFVKPSKKARKKFGSLSDTSVASHVGDKSFWVQTKINDIVIANLREVSVSCFLAMQTLTLKGEHAKVPSRFARQLQAVSTSQSTEIWKQQRPIIIRNFLSVNM
uniref:UDENN domain-containing protein n=2 Tax=Ditylum brightwellii TaxID=49249 RepID=A0A7S4R4H9_9STRA